MRGNFKLHEMETVNRDPNHNSLKRLLDLAIAGSAIFLLAPLMLVVAAAIHFTLGSPVLFRQQRPGLHGRAFSLCKFRTMSDARGFEGKPRPDAERLTALGRFLRRTSLDELPQLWNVLRGELSLVGPRPLLTQYLDRYSPEQARRLLVMPGITGWAQIHGRNAITWEEKFALDVWYVDHWSLWLDLRILATTAWRIVKPEGISAADHCTMPEFMGTASARSEVA
jgi:lipopolysaccharide/colanic/teichoic acid biosynthesis glycosyltransferase